MAENVSAEKKALRRKYMQCLNEMRGIEAASAIMAGILLSSRLYSEAAVVVGYMPVQHEPMLTPVLEDCLATGRRLLLPVYSESSGDYSLSQVGGLDGAWLEPGRYGIPEPRHSLAALRPPFRFRERALWLVPGLSFSRQGTRLGRGAGFYDRLLAGSTGTRMGVLFQLQLADSLPECERDMPMDFILTENGIIETKKLP